MLIYVPNLLILSTVAVVSALRPARYNTRDITGIGSEYSSIVVFGDSFSDNGQSQDGKPHIYLFGMNKPPPQKKLIRYKTVDIYCGS